MTLRALLLLLWLVPMSAWAAKMPGIRLYEQGKYAKASRSLRAEIKNPRRSEEDRARARVYLAASLLALKKTNEARQQLEVLAQTTSEPQVDPALFPPELVEMEKQVRGRLQPEGLPLESDQAERDRLAAQEADRLRREQEEADRLRREREGADRQAVVDAQRPPEGELEAPAGPASSFRLRPELTGYSDAAGLLTGGTVTMGPALGLTAGVGPVEATVRTLGGERWAWELEAGYLFGTGSFQPRLSVRATLFPGVGVPPENDPNGGGASFGFGGAVGGRLALSPRLTLLADVGGEYLPGVSEQFNNGVFVISAGVGYSLF